jgi:hypothetical protein
MTKCHCPPAWAHVSTVPRQPATEALHLLMTSDNLMRWREAIKALSPHINEHRMRGLEWDEPRRRARRPRTGTQPSTSSRAEEGRAELLEDNRTSLYEAYGLKGIWGTSEEYPPSSLHRCDLDRPGMEAGESTGAWRERDVNVGSRIDVGVGL